MLKRLFKGSYLFFLLFLLLWVSIFLSWQTLRSVNFAYPMLYEVMALDETIATYGPKNLYKEHFHTTSDEERFRLFENIVYSIHHDGEGLAEIVYHDSQGKMIDHLLRPPEVVHLQDVANLIGGLTTFSLVTIALLVLLLGWTKYTNMKMSFSTKRMFVGTLVFCIMLVAIVLLFGAESVFYQWHTLVFPENHQWFFYYQESLMTTMMRAPDLFGAIAAFLGILLLLYFFVLLKMVSIILKYHLFIVEK